MSSFVIYDQSTGVVRGIYTVSDAAGVADAMTANTPSGCESLAVDASHPITTSKSAWTVTDGMLAAVVPTDADLLAAAQAAQLNILAAGYSAAKSANVAYMDTFFMADDDSQQMFAHALVAYTAAGATPVDFYAVDASYNKVPMTLAQLQGLIAAIAAQVLAAFQRWVDVRQALAATTTVSEAQAIVW